MNIRKLLFSLLIAVLGIIITVLFWKRQFFLILLVFLITFIKHRIYPLKKELLLFCLSGFLGAVAESIVVLSGVWFYSEPYIFNIPIWLPFLWGLAGITGLTLYGALELEET